MDSIVLVVLGTFAGILVGRFIIRPIISRRTESKKRVESNTKNKKSRKK